MTDEQIARIAEAAHDTNRVYCLAIGDASQVHFREAEEWQWQSVIRGVKVALEGLT